MHLTAEQIRQTLADADWRGLRTFLEDAHPGRVAESLADLEPAEIVQVLRHARKEEAIEIFEFFSEETQKAIFEGMARREMAEFLEEMSSDDRADLVKRLRPELAESVLALVAEVERRDIRRLCAFREGTAGAVMTTDYAWLPVDATVAEALEQLRVQAPDAETIYYVYVVDDKRRLIGCVDLKALIVARPASQVKVGDIMERDIIKVRTDDDPIEVARTIGKYDLIAVPVADRQGRLVGIVTVDDAMDLVDPEADEPVAGGGGDRSAASVLGYVDRAAWATLRPRGVWLLATAAAIFLGWLILSGTVSAEAPVYAALVAVPLLVALGAAPGARCGAATARDLVREHRAWPSVGRNMLDGIRVGLPPALAILFVTGLLLQLRGSHDAKSAGLVIRGVIASVAQAVAACGLGGLQAVVTRALDLPPERRVSPLLLALPDALGAILYVAVVWFLA